MSEVRNRKLWAGLAVLSILSLTVYLLRSQGRLWRCSCGRFLLWSGNIWSADNSQHFLDPYSFTHLLHGFLFCALLAWCVPRVPILWRRCLAVALESAWEIIENSESVIRRYRETTAALGYEGDAVINSLGDILVCGLGFLLARRLGWSRSIVVFILTEAVLLFWIRDSLILNVVMLLHPVDWIKAWQTGR